MSNKQQLIEHYTRNRAAKKGDTITCVMCPTQFEKKTYHQCFCSNGTVSSKSCKDKYHNLTNEKRAMALNARFRDY
jgi:hypothetical protein